jgi:FkbM family methyltransferase
MKLAGGARQTHLERTEMIHKNAITAIKNPRMLLEYGIWQIKRVYSAGNPEKRMPNGVRIANLTGFSEYVTFSTAMTNAELKFFRERDIGPGALLDVGAHVGLISLTLAQCHPDRTIHAFEPSLSTFAALSANIKLNKVEHIRHHQLAVSNTIGEIEFNADTASRANASVAIAGATNAIRVPATTLDKYCKDNNITQIDLLKVDVEGFESLVFAGATHVLEKVRPNYIMFEVCPPLMRRAGLDPTEPAKILERTDYKIWRLMENGELQPVVSEAAGETVVENWVARPAEISNMS